MERERPTAWRQGEALRARGHVVLLGASVFDDAGHGQGGGPDAVAQLRRVLPARWRATLAASGGSAGSDVPGQLGALPPGATHLGVSAGGNDAGRRGGVLGEPARSVVESLAPIAAVREGSARDYLAMLGAAIGCGRASAACTVYAPRFPEPGRRRSNPRSLGRLVMVEGDEAGCCAGAPACPATVPPPLRAIPSGGTE